MSPSIQVFWVDWKCHSYQDVGRDYGSQLERITEPGIDFEVPVLYLSIGNPVGYVLLFSHILNLGARWSRELPGIWGEVPCTSHESPARLRIHWGLWDCVSAMTLLDVSSCILGTEQAQMHFICASGWWTAGNFTNPLLAVAEPSPSAQSRWLPSGVHCVPHWAGGFGSRVFLSPAAVFPFQNWWD
jgi:hypothetical protein